MLILSGPYLFVAIVFPKLHLSNSPTPVLLFYRKSQPFQFNFVNIKHQKKKNPFLFCLSAEDNITPVTGAQPYQKVLRNQFKNCLLIEQYYDA